MAKIGLKNFYYSVATENATTGALTYGGATKLAKAISASFEPTVSDATLYADDAIAERDAGVTGGTLTLGIDRYDLTTAAALLGHTLGTDGEMVSNTTDTAPIVGVGRVVTLMQDGAYKYRAVFFPKVRFQEPSSSNQTKGETTEFGTYEITGTVIPPVDGNWRKEQIFDTEAAAVAYLVGLMGAESE